MRGSDIWSFTGLSLRNALAAAALFTALTGPAHPQTMERCAASNWSITGGTAYERELICEGVARAEALLGSCGITRSEPVDMVVATSLLDFCGSKAHAVFDSRDKTISIAPRDVCISQRVDKGLFELISPDIAYRSIAAHEATHAILDANGMRPEQWVGNEYVAAVTQFAAIPAEERENLIRALRKPAPVTARQINGLMYGLAPLLFAARSWLHYSALQDPCAFLNDVVSGTYTFVDMPF